MLSLGAIWGWAVKITPRPLYFRGRFPVSVLLESEWDPRPFWTGVQKRKAIAPTEV
jgi:hypothetical protein